MSSDIVDSGKCSNEVRTKKQMWPQYHRGHSLTTVSRVAPDAERIRSRSLKYR